MKEIVLDDLEDKKVQYIENPLPVPKRREHKEMDFAFEPTGNDDYDLKDMSGKDFLILNKKSIRLYILKRTLTDRNLEGVLFSCTCKSWAGMEDYNAESK